MRKKMLVLTVLLVWLGAAAQTSTFTYTASEKISRFDEFKYFVGADSVISHDYDELTGVGTVVYSGQVTELGTACLQWMSPLESIVIPEGVTIIGFQAFYNCQNLSGISLPKSVNHIKNLAFDGCTGLKNKPFVIDDLAWWCGITFESVYANPLYYARHCYSDETTEITHLVIPEGVTCIGNYAFCRCEGITSLSLPESLSKIGGNAFDHCDGLRSVCIPAGVTEIGGAAFNTCSKLESVTIPEGVTEIGLGAFSHTGLRQLTLPSTIRSMSQSFNDCDSLVSLTLTEGITTLGNSFYNCRALPEVCIPSSVRRMMYNDFNNCNSLERVTIAEGVEAITGFNNCTKLSSITIPSSATSITSFKQCSSLQSIYVPKGVSEFTGFYGCTSLQKIIIEDLASWCNILFSSYATSNAQYYAKHLFLGTPDDNEEITALVIPEGVTQLKRYAFSNVEGITTVTLPTSLKSLDNTAFNDCSAVSNVYALCDPLTLSWGGGGFKPERATLMHVVDTTMWLSRFPAANVTFVGDISRIAYNATAKEEAFDKVSAFTGATYVVEHEFNVETGEGSLAYLGPVTALADEALAGATTLTSLTLNEGLTFIGAHAFAGCEGLSAVSLPSTTSLFNAGAFEGVTKLADVYCFAEPDQLTWDDSDNAEAFLPDKATLFHVAEIAPWIDRYPDANVTFVPFCDLNGDGYVNTGDVSELYSALLEGVTNRLYDLNGDGSVNTGDVSFLFVIILGR